MRTTWDDDMPRIPSDDELETTIAEVKAKIDQYNLTAPRKLRMIDSFDWAKLGDVVHLVYGHFPVTSQAPHHAPGDLDRYLQVEDGVLIAIRPQLEMDGIESMLLDCAKFAFVAVEKFGNAQGLEMPEAIVEFYQRHCEMCESMADRVLGDGTDDLV